MVPLQRLNGVSFNASPPSSRAGPGQTHLRICATVWALTRIFHTVHEPPTARSRRRKEADSFPRPVRPPPHVGGYVGYEIFGLTLHLSPFPPRGRGRVRRRSRQFACHAAAPSPRPSPPPRGRGSPVAPLLPQWQASDRWTSRAANCAD